LIITKSNGGAKGRKVLPTMQIAGLLNGCHVKTIFGLTMVLNWKFRFLNLLWRTKKNGFII
jgi:hypothetical protein